MNCPYGKISRILDNGMGVNALSYVKSVDRVPQTNACLVNETTFGNQQCSDFMDQTLIHYNFERYCRGKASCFFSQESVNQIFAANPATIKVGDATTATTNECLTHSTLFV